MSIALIVSIIMVVPIMIIVYHLIKLSDISNSRKNRKQENILAKMTIKEIIEKSLGKAPPNCWWAVTKTERSIVIALEGHQSCIAETKFIIPTFNNKVNKVRLEFCIKTAKENIMSVYEEKNVDNEDIDGIYGSNLGK